jgi:carbonic anhydrase
MSASTSVPALDALRRLREGNGRFKSGLRSIGALASMIRRDDFVHQQSPFAIVLSCSDSRVPAELVFDCGLGDLFMVRVAGNVVAPSLVGSVEFAAATYGTQLVVVMGHTRCGAIAATLDTLERKGEPPSENVRDIVERIAPAIVAALQAPTREAQMQAAVRANVVASAEHLRHGSPILERLVAEGKLVIVGAEYALETGGVDFFDGVPAGLE